LIDHAEIVDRLRYYGPDLKDRCPSCNDCGDQSRSHPLYFTLLPFPEKAIAENAGRTEGVIVVKMNMGQILEDIKLAVYGKKLRFSPGRQGDAVILIEDILSAIQNCAQGNTAEKKNVVFE